MPTSVHLELSNLNRLPRHRDPNIETGRALCDIFDGLLFDGPALEIVKDRKKVWSEMKKFLLSKTVEDYGNGCTDICLVMQVVGQEGTITLC